MKELIEELRQELGPAISTELVVQLASSIYLGNSISAAAKEIADAIQYMGEMDTRNMLVPMIPLDEYGDD